ncbi:MAG: hypothetical protein V3U29_04385, partial [Phycisphaeraceae bacterium]
IGRPPNIDPRKKALSRRFAYRHSNEQLNAVFYDGHGRTMSDEESRKTALYFPAGSTVRFAPGTMDPDDNDGDLIR